jgi:hypothetical protein
VLKFSIQEDRRRKVKMPTSAEASLDPLDEVDVAVETKRARYVPKDVIVRAWFGDKTFTGRTCKKNLEALEQDTNVKSVEVAEPLRLIQSKGARKTRKK